MVVMTAVWHLARSIFWHTVLVAGSLPDVARMYRNAVTDDVVARTVASFVDLPDPDEVTS